MPDTDPESDGVQARLDGLNLSRRQFAALVPVSTNTLQRVIEGAGSPSSRRRIVAMLAELEADEGCSRPDAAKLRAIENMLLDSEIRDARMRFGSSGRTRFVTIFAHDPGMTEDELVEEERLWRAARSDD